MTARLCGRWFIVLASIALAAQDEEVRWKKTVAPDRSFSLHYPDAWAVAHNAATVTLRNDPGGEQMMVIRLSRDGSKQPGAYAEQIAGLFQKSDPNFRMTGLKVQGENAGFHLQYSPNYSGIGLVIEHPSTVFWVSYASLNPANVNRGAALLTAMTGSISDNADSPPPIRLRVAVATRGGGQAPAPDRPPAPSTGGGSAVLVGTWSTTAYFGELVDRSTGVPVQGSYNGQWYTFRGDGTYHYAMTASGQIITGVILADGTYELRGAQLVVHQKTTSWYPFPRSVRSYPRYENKVDPKDISYGIEFHNAVSFKLKPPTGYADEFKKQPGK